MKSKKGISLIVLVITIVVMIILAGAIIISLNNTGVIKKANEAVEASDEAAIKELAQMGWADAYLKDESTEKDDEYYQKEVMEYLAKQGMTDKQLGKYLIHATTKGVTVKQADKVWVQKGLTVVRGEDVLEIGDVVNYDETKGGTVSVEKDVTWRVLGADEDGNLLIMSADSVVTSDYALGGFNRNEGYSAEQLEQAKDAFINGPSKLNTVCKAYGYGKGVVGVARSIKVEDVNKVTGYDPKTAKYAAGEMGAYGNEITYEWKGLVAPSYTYYNGNTKVEGNYHLGTGSSFTYFDGKKFVTSTHTEQTTTSPVFITKIINDDYIYYGTTLTYNLSDENKGLSSDSKAYKMLFRDSANSKDDRYWLASRSIYGDILEVNFCLRAVGANGMVTSWELLQSSLYYYRNNFRCPCGSYSVFGYPTYRFISNRMELLKI